MFSFPTSIMSCSLVSMDKITALFNSSEKILANRLIMTSYFFIPLLILYLIISFISGVVSLYSSSYSFLCSLPRFLTQPSVSLGESLEPRVFSLVSPMQSSLFLNGGGVFFFYFLHQVYYPFLPSYLGYMVLEYFILLWLKCPNSSFFYSCKEYVVYLVIQLIHLHHVQTYQKDLDCILWYLFIWGFIFWYFYQKNSWWNRPWFL